MTFSKDVLDNVLTFLKANIEAVLVLCEADYHVTVDRVKHFETYVFNDGQTPFAVLYEEQTPYEMETLQNYLKRFELAVDVKDSGFRVDQVRANLYAYRDAVSYLVEHNPTLGNICVQAYMIEVKPPLLMQDAGGANWTGVIEMKFTVETVG